MSRAVPIKVSICQEIPMVNLGDASVPVTVPPTPVNPLTAAAAIEAAAGAHIPAVAPGQAESSIDPKLNGLGAVGVETDDGSLVAASVPLVEDSEGWACSPRSRRSNHGRLRVACNLHCKYISQTGIFFDLADSSSSIGVPSGEDGAHGSSSDSFSSPGEPTCAHTQIEGEIIVKIGCWNKHLRLWAIL